MDYDIFKFFSENREITEARARKIRKSIEKKYITNPIIVNEKMEIIDGQGRYTVLKELGMPIQYIIYPGGNADDCRMMNVAMTNWSAKDFIKSYATAGDENYIRLESEIEEMDYTVENILKACGKSVHSNLRCGVRKNIVTSGDLKFSEKDKEMSMRVLKMVEELWKDALCSTKRMSNEFIGSAIIVIRTIGYDHKRMMDNLSKERHSFIEQHRIMDQLREFSRIYNYKRTTNKVNFETMFNRKTGKIQVGV